MKEGKEERKGKKDNEKMREWGNARAFCVL